MEYKGLSVSVYRSHGQDCTGGGVTADKQSVILIDENGGDLEAPFTGDETNTVILKRKSSYRWGDYLYAEPLTKPKNCAGPMMGGNFIYSSDSRFPSKYPIPVHDRFETWECYNAMSRD